MNCCSECKTKVDIKLAPEEILICEDCLVAIKKVYLGEVQH